MTFTLDWDESYSMQANVTNPGYQNVVLRGYVTERRPDGVYAAPLLPQLFYGASGSQLSTWRQYLPGTGSQTILSRAGGQPSIPKEELYWRKVSEPGQIVGVQAAPIPASAWILALIIGIIGWVAYKKLSGRG